MRRADWSPAVLFLLAALAGCGGGGGAKDAVPEQAAEVAEVGDALPEEAQGSDLPLEESVCPGECCADAECDDGNPCTDDSCSVNACLHAPRVCVDEDPCTVDACDPAKGCIFEAIPGCCSGDRSLLELSFEDPQVTATLLVEDLAAPAATPATWQVSSVRYHSPAHSFYFGVPSLGSYDTGARVASRFETAPLPLPAGRKASMSFWVWLDVEEDAGWDEFNLSAVAGGQVVPLTQKDPALVDQKWHKLTLDLGAFAGGEVRLRFTFDSVDGTNNNFNGVYVDDLVVTAVCEEASCADLAGCADGLVCTGEACESGACVFQLVEGCCLNAVDCDDRDACTQDQCAAGQCAWTPVGGEGCCNADADCEDGDACTADLCRAERCVHPPSGLEGCCDLNADCDDGDACTLDLCVASACQNQPLCCDDAADCFDGEETCTLDLCVDGACLHQPTGAPGCCQPTLLDLDFDDGKWGPVSALNSDAAVGWHIFGGAGASSSDTPALYYGNPADPTHLTYDNQGINHGTASLPLTLLPARARISLGFKAFLDTEASPDFDKLQLHVVLGPDRFLVWDKHKLVNTGVWTGYEVDLTAFAGQEARLEFAFDTVDSMANGGEGVYLDDLVITSSCADRVCEKAEDCEDGLAATVDACGADGVCAYQFKLNPCAGDDQCNDARPCTADACLEGFCEFTPLAGCCEEADNCDDGNPCTQDVCDPGPEGSGCSHPWLAGCCLAAEHCNDHDPCTVDSCPTSGGACLFTPLAGCCLTNAGCDDLDPTTLDDCTTQGCRHRPAACATSTDCAATPCSQGYCVDSRCYYLPDPSGACCNPAILDVDFDDGTAGPFELINAQPEVGWRVSDLLAGSPPFALYYGDAAGESYDNGAANAGRVLSPVLYLPANSALGLSFKAFFDVEPQPDYDPFLVLLHTSNGPVTVWEKSHLAGQVGAWTVQAVDLTPYAGEAVRLEFAFNTQDKYSNDGRGIFLDDVRLTTSCNPAECALDSQCASFDACMEGACVEGMCLFSERPGCCNREQDCDDLNQCTLDACAGPGADCEHAWQAGCCFEQWQCEDADPCTLDQCDPLAHECSHEVLPGCCARNLDCDDGQAGTWDVCTPDGCVHRPATCGSSAACADDDACTTEACNAGACVFLALDQPGCCSRQLLDAAFDINGAEPFTLVRDPGSSIAWHVTQSRSASAPASLYFGLEHGDGVACDDGRDYTAGDGWAGEVCLGVVTEAPGLFHVYEMGLASPPLTWDLGGGPTQVNAALGAYLTSLLGPGGAGRRVVLVDPLRPGYGFGSVSLGGADCTTSGGIVDACTPSGPAARFEGAALDEQAACGGGLLSPPCLASQPAGPVQVDLVLGQVAATRGWLGASLTGKPYNGLVDGQAHLFVPLDQLAGVKVPAVALGQEVSLAQLLAGRTPEVLEGVEGHWLEVSFSARKAAYVGPGGCESDPLACRDDSPCTRDACDFATGTCLHLAGPEGGACTDSSLLTVHDRCQAGACTGFPVAEPLAWRVTSLAPASPALTWDPGDGPRLVNDAVAAELTASLGAGQELVLLTEPGQLPAGLASTLLGPGMCSGSGASRACTVNRAAPLAAFQGLQFPSEGYCLADPAVPAPCLASATASDVQVDLPSLGLAAARASLAAALAGTPPTALDHGHLFLFVTTEQAAQIQLPVDASSFVALDALLVGVPTEQVDGLTGWRLDLAFHAERTMFQAGDSCTDDPSACDDLDPASVDLCRPLLDACSHLPREVLPPVGSYQVGQRVSGSAVSAPLTLPPTTELTLGFALYADVEPGPGRDLLDVRLLGDNGPVTVWDKVVLDQGDYRSWTAQVADLSPFAGQTVRLEFRFDSMDGQANAGQGVFVDDVSLSSSCAPKACATLGDCASADPCVAPSCVQGRCLFVPRQDCCLAQAECDDGDACTVDACTEHACTHQAVPGCCNTVADCDDQEPCTLDACQDQACVHSWDAGCATPVPYREAFEAAGALSDLGWSAQALGGGAANWRLEWQEAPYSGHLHFDDSPVVVGYQHRAVSPLLDASAANSLSLVFTAAFQAYALANTATECAAEVSSDGGATWTTVWSETYATLDAPSASQVVNVGAMAAGSAKVRLAFRVSGATSFDLLGWHVDDVGLLTGAAPEVVAVGDRTATVGDELVIPLDLQDADGDPLTVELDPGTPPFIQAAAVGDGWELRLQPLPGDLGSYLVGFSVTDGQFVVHSSFGLTVKTSEILFREDFNGAASLEAVGWSLRLDTNPEAGPHWQLAASGSVDNSPSAWFSWEPAVTNFSEWLISPVFDASGAGQVPVQLQFGHMLDVYSASNVILTALASADGGQTWLPAWERAFVATEVAVGPEQVTVPVGGLLAASDKARLAFRIQGADSNTLYGWYLDDVQVLVGAVPEIQAPARPSALVGQQTLIPVTVSDADGDACSLSLVSGPAFVSLVDHGDGSASLVAANPQASDWGTHPVVLAATDGTFNVTLTVLLVVTNPGEQILLEEGFDGDIGFPEAGWNLELLPADAQNWAVVQEGAAGYAHFSFEPEVLMFQQRIVSPPVAVAGMQRLILSWRQRFGAWDQFDAEPPVRLSVSVSSDDGATWQDVWSHSELDGDLGGWQAWVTETLDLSGHVGMASSLRVGFAVDGGDSDGITYWSVDDVFLLGMNNP